MLRLKELRIDAGINQTELAKALNTARNNISQWENEVNEMSYSMLLTVAKYFNVSIDYLLGYADDIGNIAYHEEFTKEDKAILSKLQKLDIKEKKVITNLLDTLLRQQSVDISKKL